MQPPIIKPIIIDCSKNCRIALPACRMDDMGRSRMVLPGAGSPKARNKPNDIKVDPSYLVEAYFL